MIFISLTGNQVSNHNQGSGGFCVHSMVTALKSYSNGDAHQTRTLGQLPPAYRV